MAHQALRREPEKSTILCERDLGLTTSTADDLDYMHARFYNMQIARFHAFDPIGGNPRVPQSWNRFAYVLGNPMKLIDPTGMLDVGFASAIYVSLQFVYFDEITVSAVSGSGSGSSSSGLSSDQSSFRNFLFGNHAGGGSFGRERSGTSLTLADRILSSIPDRPAQTVGNAIAGFGDTLSFGLTEWVRKEQGLENTIDTTSGAYTVGEVAGYVEIAALGTAGAVRAASAAGVETRVGLHGAHHTFGRLGRLPHIQVNVWRTGVKGSGRALIRIPLPRWIGR